MDAVRSVLKFPWPLRYHNIHFLRSPARGSILYLIILSRADADHKHRLASNTNTNNALLLMFIPPIFIPKSG
jgi:hypothetical protein